jgi:uncharacterized DUF497 family protein
MTRPAEVGPRFEWDEPKAELNKRKHGISFPLATQAFKDPLAERKIEGDEHGEVRWQAIGQVGRVLVRATYTTREEEDGIEVIRIISARKLTPRERRAYERHPKDDR